MEIIISYPPNYDLITTFIPEAKAVYAYKGKLYNPHNLEITPDIELHEQVHIKQQGDDSDGWWQKYLTDKDFRLSQELEAYGTQYTFIQKTYNELEDKLRSKTPPETCGASKAIEWGLDKMSWALSADSYGKLLSYGAARSKIRNYAKHHA